MKYGFGIATFLLVSCTSASTGSNMDAAADDVGDAGSADAGMHDGGTEAPREFTFVSEEVSFSNPVGPVALLGTMTVPNRTNGARSPAVVLVHGSGPADRNETADGSLMVHHPQVQLFLEVSEHLSRRGFAVLRYDKRTCISINSEGRCPKPAFDYDIERTTLDDYVADAEAAMAFLAADPRVDSERLVVIGHSQGAKIAPTIAKRIGAPLRAIVLLGPPAHENVVDEEFDQKRFILRYLRALTASPQTDQEITQLEAEIAGGLPLLQAIWDGRSDAPYDGVPAAHWRSWLRYAESLRPLLGEVDTPVLALAGTLDFNTPAVPYLDRVRAWRGNRPTDHIEKVPLSNHMFVSPIDPSLEGRIRPDVLEHIAIWLLRTLGMTDEPLVTFRADTITPVRDAFLCEILDTPCDFGELDRRLDWEPNTLPATTIVAAIADRAGGKATQVETMSAVMTTESGAPLYCQDDRVVGQKTFVLRTCWKEGPRLAGIHFQ